MQQMIVNDRKQHTIYESSSTPSTVRGRKTQFVEDIRPAQDNYGTALKGSLALGRLLTKITEPEEVVGVLLPNVGPGIYTLLGLWAFRRIPAMINYTAGLDGMQSALRAAKSQDRNHFEVLPGQGSFRRDSQETRRSQDHLPRRLAADAYARRQALADSLCAALPACGDQARQARRIRQWCCSPQDPKANPKA